MKIITDHPTHIIDESLGVSQANWDSPAHLGLGQISMDRLFRTVALEPSGAPLPLPYAESALNIKEMLFADPLMQGRQIDGEQLLNRRVFNDGLIVMHRGEVVHESYRNGMTAEDRHVIHSCSKSLCSMLVATAVDDSLLCPEHDIDTYIPEFRGIAAWAGVTVQHVLDMQAGIEYSEDYSDPDAHYWRYARAAGYYPPHPGEEAIGAKAWVLANLNNRVSEPGTTFPYNSCLSIVLGMALENVYKRPLAELFEEFLYRKIGAEDDAYFNTDPQGFPIVEGQMNLRLRDFARWAGLLVNGGRNLAGDRVLTEGFVDQFIAPDGNAKAAYQRKNKDTLFRRGQYKNQFWVFDTELEQFSMLGIHGQFAWYDLKRQLMLVGVGSFPQQDGDLLMRSLNTLWQGVAKHL